MSSIHIDVDGIRWTIWAIGKGLLATPHARHASWHASNASTPSGKAIFICDVCGRESVGHEKYCPIGRTISLGKYLVVEEYQDGE